MGMKQVLKERWAPRKGIGTGRRQMRRAGNGHSVSRGRLEKCGEVVEGEEEK